jgi:ferrous-iron efflux pump FieF
MKPTAKTGARLNISATVAAVLVAALLVALKLWALSATGALSIGASLVDSALDLMMSAGGLAAVAYAARPPDADHAFGHSSAEDLAALGQSLFILVSAAVIATAAFMRLASGAPPPLEAELGGIGAMLVSFALTLALVLWQRRVARATGSRVVAADALHYLGDLVPGIGAIVSLAASAWLGLEAIDSVVALGAAVFIAAGAVRIGVGGWNALMDRAADPATVAAIDEVVCAQLGVRGHHDLKTRTAGSRLFVNLHLELDGTMTLAEAHAIGEATRHALVARLPQADVIIHHDPV